MLMLGSLLTRRPGRGEALALLRHKHYEMIEKSSGGGDAWLVVIQRPDTAGLLPGYSSVSVVISARAYPPLPETPE